MSLENCSNLRESEEDRVDCSQIAYEAILEFLSLWLEQGGARDIPVMSWYIHNYAVYTLHQLQNKSLTFGKQRRT